MLAFVGYPTITQAVGQKVFLGIDVLERSGFNAIAGQRIGLLTHPAGVNREGIHTITTLQCAPNVNLVALFGPEHGVYGDEKAETPIADRIDRRSGLPVYSLYGRYRKPTPAMLAGLAALVIDLQDLGVRSYTYISCMRKVMEACFENQVTVVVLDRPNPLGGYKVDGPIMEQRWMSYVGAFPIPYVYGLTIGELAYMAQDRKGWLAVEPAVQAAGQLIVIPMYGWRRSMRWPETGLHWVPTSPAIPDLSAALGYAMTGLGAQLGGFHHGYGYGYPFRLLTFAGKTPRDIAVALRAKGITGLEYQSKPYIQPDGTPAKGLYLRVKDWQTLRPTAISFHMMQLACTWSSGNPFARADHRRAELFNKHVGSTAWWETLCSQGARIDVDAFLQKWQADARRFQAASRPYWLYR